MKVLHIEAKYGKPVQISEKIASELPSSLGLVSSIQFIDSLPLIKKSLNKNKKIKKIIICGQVLGCDVKNAGKVKVDAFLYIGDGKFHPLAVALGTGKPVFMFNPLNNSFKKIEKKDVENYKKRRKGALTKFLHAENIGILVSTKPGQYYDIKKLKSTENKFSEVNLISSNKLLEKKYKDKKFYTFVCETVDYKQLENFPFIEAWVNTACPRIEEDISVVNVGELK